MSIHGSMLPALGVLLCLRSAMQAMGEKRAPITASCIELGMKFFAAAWLIPTLGFLGTSLTEPVTWGIMAAYLIGVYARKKEAIQEA